MGSSDEEIAAILAGCAGCDPVRFSYEKPRHKVPVAAFWIDRTEVTNAQYKLCVETGPCKEPQSGASLTRQAYYGNPEYADYPVVNVTWGQAHKYAEWVGGRLCTEAEWEYACRGAEGHDYPWGDHAPAASYLDYLGSGVGDTTKAGTYTEGKSWCGALDMSGNVWEWTQSIFTSYPFSPADGREGLEAPGQRVLRGGAFASGAVPVRCAFRGPQVPGYSDPYDGFRVCVPAQQD